MDTLNKNEKRALFNRLALKIIAAISISVLLIQLAFIGLIEGRIYNTEYGNIVDQQITFTEANAIYIAELISEDNEDSIHLILSSIVANPLIIGAALQYTNDQKTIYVGDDPSSLKYSFDIKDFNNDDELVSVGKLVTYATTAFIDESRSTRVLGILTLMLIVFLVVLFVTTLAVQLFIGVPLKRITSAIQSHNRVPKINWQSRDEMGTVVTRLNFLHSTLNNQLSGLEQKLSANERREAARISSLANASLEGILIYRDDCIIDLNYPMAQLLGRSRESALSTPLSALFDQNIQDFLRQSLSNSNRPLVSTSLNQSEAQSIPVEIYLNKLEDHGEGNKVAVVRDVSERVAAEKAMWRLAHYDSLTGLPNRRYFSENLDLAINRAREQHLTLSVAYLDLDNFKFLNDSRGHAVGDQLLCGVAQSLESTLGSSENCARLGGDEFAILIEEDSSSEPLEQLMKTVFSEMMTGPHCLAWKNIFSLSVGVASLKDQTIEKSELLKRADLALYKAKESGRAQIYYYSEHLDAKLTRERQIVERLIPAIEQDRLELHYQAQVLCDKSSITGFEALLRWNDPVLGPVSPVEIVEIAEREGIVSQLGRWVMSKACVEAKNWPDTIRLAVNLSPLELADDSLVGFIADTLKSTGFPAARLEIEITETALVSDTGKATRLLQMLKEMDIKIALDDFGTGYSSLSMLQEFPFDRIKIDRSFVSNLSEDDSKISIVASIVHLGSRLDLDVIAEGVESESDVATLRQLNCRECQGYLISRPVLPDQLPAIIDQYADHPAQQMANERHQWPKAG